MKIKLIKKPTQHHYNNKRAVCVVTKFKMAQHIPKITAKYVGHLDFAQKCMVIKKGTKSALQPA